MIWWWLGNVVLLLVVIPVVAFLALRIVRRSKEVRDYTSDILTHGLGITANLDPVPALAESVEWVGVVREEAIRYARTVAHLLARAR